MRSVFVVAMAMTTAMPATAQDMPPLAKPIGNPGSWIPENAYPPGAKASAEEGRVAFTLTIDETGHATECKVTTSSESPDLDDATCNLMIANGRFVPPKDKKGKPVESRWNSSVRWKLESAPPVSGTPPAAQTPPKP